MRPMNESEAVIRNADGSIINNKKKGMEKEKRCPTCGAVINDDFCTECGEVICKPYGEATDTIANV